MRWGNLLKWILFYFVPLCWPVVSVLGVENIFVVDVLVVLDRPAYNRWVQREPATLPAQDREQAAETKMKEYISLVIRQANLHMESMPEEELDWSVQLSVQQFILGVNPLSGIANPLLGSVSLQATLSTFKVWVQASGHTTFDYIFLFTGYKLLPSSDLPYDIKGIANIGAVCKGDGTQIAIVEDRGAFQSPRFVAHEFGHGLGAKHDGESPNEACPDTDGYLMSNSSEITDFSWLLSTCSRVAIRDHLVLTNLHKSPCLKETQTPAPEFVTTEGLLAGQVYDANTQCKHLYGDKSRMCWGGSFGQPEDICTSLLCLDTSSTVLSGSQCLQHVAAEGTTCGDRKVCHKGRCIASSQAPVARDCQFGDQSVLFEGRYTCDQYINLRKDLCNLPEVKSACCSTCAAVASSSPACPYGDERRGCTTDLCKLVNPDGVRYEELCCSTCGYNVSTPCSDVTSVDGMTCGQRVVRGGVQGCYDPALAYSCCQTCASLRTNVTGCEYGDKVTDGSCGQMSRSTCLAQASDCCHSCRNETLNNSSSPNTAPSIRTGQGVYHYWCYGFILLLGWIGSL